MERILSNATAILADCLEGVAQAFEAIVANYLIVSGKTHETEAFAARTAEGLRAGVVERVADARSKMQ